MKDDRHDKRRVGRYGGSAVKRVKTAVQTADGASFGGQLHDVSIAGAAIRFSVNEAPSLRRGQSMTITLRLPLPNKKFHVVDIQARVRHIDRDDETKSVRCGLQFDHRVARGSALYTTLRALANRRAETRLAPGEDEKISMVLKTDDGAEISGNVRDISANGARVMVGGDFETDAIGLDSIALSFRLPSEEHDTVIAVHIRNQQAEKNRTCIGLQFDDQETPNFRAQQKEVMSYLMKRQRDLIRK